MLDTKNSDPSCSTSVFLLKKTQNKTISPKPKSKRSPKHLAKHQGEQARAIVLGMDPPGLCSADLSPLPLTESHEHTESSEGRSPQLQLLPSAPAATTMS